MIVLVKLGICMALKNRLSVGFRYIRALESLRSTTLLYSMKEISDKRSCPRIEQGLKIAWQISVISWCEDKNDEYYDTDRISVCCAGECSEKGFEVGPRVELFPRGRHMTRNLEPSSVTEVGSLLSGSSHS
jgi:hypothetical protein